jgi:hypothetical protein
MQINQAPPSRKRGGHSVSAADPPARSPGAEGRGLRWLARDADAFIDAVFAQGPALSRTSPLRKRDYLERIVRGGYPEALRRSSRRRAAFFDSYLTILIERDVKQPGNDSRMRARRERQRDRRRPGPGESPGPGEWIA